MNIYSNPSTSRWFLRRPLLTWYLIYYYLELAVNVMRTFSYVTNAKGNRSLVSLAMDPVSTSLYVYGREDWPLAQTKNCRDP